jgi:hypothetical protein
MQINRTILRSLLGARISAFLACVLLAPSLYAANVMFTQTNQITQLGDTNTIKISAVGYIDSEGNVHTTGFPISIWPTNPPGSYTWTNMAPGVYVARSFDYQGGWSPVQYSPGQFVGPGMPGTPGGVVFWVDGSTNTYPFTRYVLSSHSGGYTVLNLNSGIVGAIGTNGIVVSVANGVLTIDGSQFTPTVTSNSLSGQINPSQIYPAIPNYFFFGTNVPGITTNSGGVWISTNYDAIGTAAAVGQGATNYANAVGSGATNLANSVASNSTNYANQVGYALTNLQTLTAMALTNYANALAAANTNYANSVGSGATNLAGTVSSNGTNYANQVGSAISNNVVLLQNNSALLQAEHGAFTGAIMASGGTGTYAAVNGTNVFNAAGSPLNFTNGVASEYITTNGLMYVSGVEVATNKTQNPVGGTWIAIAGSGSLPTTVYFTNLLAAGNNTTVSTVLGLTVISSSGGGSSTGVGTNTPVVVNSGSTIFIGTNYDALGAATTQGGANTNYSIQLATSGTNYANQVGSGATNYANNVAANGTNYANQLAANGTNYANTVSVNATNQASVVLNSVMSTNLVKNSVTNAQGTVSFGALTFTTSLNTHGNEVIDPNGDFYFNNSQYLYDSSDSSGTLGAFLGVNSSGYPTWLFNGGSLTNIAMSGVSNLNSAVTAIYTSITNQSAANTNYANVVGANGTNYANTLAGNGTNYANQMAANGTNYANSVGSGATNYANAVASNGTNYANVVGANGTNYANNVAANGTNYANSVGSGATNYANAIGLGNTNYSQAMQTNMAAFNSLSINGSPLYVTNGSIIGVASGIFEGTYQTNAGAPCLTNLNNGSLSNVLVGAQWDFESNGVVWYFKSTLYGTYAPAASQPTPYPVVAYGGYTPKDGWIWQGGTVPTNVQTAINNATVSSASNVIAGISITNGTFSGNGGGLTNVSTSTAGVATNLNLSTAALQKMGHPPGLVDWWNMYNVSTNNGALFTNGWVGVNGNVLTGNAWYSANGVRGKPGFMFDGTGGNILTNGTLLGYNLTNQGTIFVVHRKPRQQFIYGTSSPQTVLSGYVSDSFYAAFYASYGTIPVFPSLFSSTCNGYNLSALDTPNYNLADDTRIYTFTWSTNLDADYWDGNSDNMYPGGWWNTTGNSPVGFAGILAVGQLGKLAWPLNGYVSDVMVFSNQLTATQIGNVNTYLVNYYNPGRLTILLFADSTPSGTASQGGLLTDFLSTNFPGSSIINLGVPGATSTQMASNVVNWVASHPANTGTTVGLVWFGLYNGQESLTTITNNEILMATNLSANGVIPILVSPYSQGFVDTNTAQVPGGGEPIRFAWQNQWTNYWNQYYRGIVRLDLDPYIGPSNACFSSGVTWFPLGGYISGYPSHLTNNGEGEAANQWFTPTINQVLYQKFNAGATFNNVDIPTNALGTHGYSGYMTNGVFVTTGTY